MKAKNIIYTTILLLSLTSCNKTEDHYESKNVQVDSVFDKDYNADTKKDDDPIKDNDDKNKVENNKEENKENQDKDDSREDINNEGKRYRVPVSVNLRRDPDSNLDNIIEAIDEGSELESTEEIEENGQTWIKVNHNGNTGFIVKDLLEEINNQNN